MAGHVTNTKSQGSDLLRLVAELTLLPAWSLSSRTDGAELSETAKEITVNVNLGNMSSST